MVTNPETPAAGQPQTSPKRNGVVKQVLSGDSVIIRGPPRGGPPLEMQLNFSSVIAPRLARRGNPAGGDATEDEPFAWEVREFLRKKVIGKDVQVVVDHQVSGSGREYGSLWLVQDGQPVENVIETMVSEGWLEVKKAGVRPDEQYTKLTELEESAKASGRGRWQSNIDPKEHIRQITWQLDNPKQFFDANKKKPIKAVVEFVRDCCTVRATLLPEFVPAMIALTGIRGPSFKQDGTKDEYADEAKFFTESRILQRDVEIILEGVNNNLLIGTIVHPAGSITEALLKQGFARCVDWSISMYTAGPENLRACEKEAKEKKIRIWKNYEPTQSNVRADEKHYSAKVVEINNADSITVKLDNGHLKKIFISGVRPPKLVVGEGEAAAPPKAPGTKFKPIYDIPYMFEAREFLRKKLIGQKVDVTLDYVQQPRATENERDFPERHCCSVVIGDTNIAEALLSRGLGTIVFYRQDDEQRPSNYDVLLAAEEKAKTGKKGLHGKKATTGLRVADVSNDSNKAKAFLPGFQRAGKMEAIVEYVGSGSRFRIYIPKNSCVVTLMLAGVRCPKGSRMGPSGAIVPAEEGGEAALNFSKEMCAQHDVQVEISDMDKVGNFIGWMYVDGKNVSLELVEAGHASVNHYSAERSPYLAVLEKAEASAKERKLNIWANFKESEAEVKTEDDVQDRTEHYRRVMVVETMPNLHFFAQSVDDGPKLESLMENIRQEFSNSPPLQGAYVPKRGDICGARFSDGQWYRAKVEAVTSSGGKADILYIDYGNRETTSSANLAPLAQALKSVEPMAKEYALAFVREHTEDSGADYKFEQLVKDGKPVLLNVEYQNFVSVLKSETKEDVAKTLISEGYVLVDVHKERRFQKIMEEYKEAQERAKRSRLNIWEYGDITADDAKEFGHQGR